MNAGHILLIAFLAGIAFWCAAVWFGSWLIAAGMLAIIALGFWLIAETDATYQEGQ